MVDNDAKEESQADRGHHPDTAQEGNQVVFAVSNDRDKA